MHRLIPDFAAARVLVVGDAILDRYWTGHADRISPEAPVAVVRIETKEDGVGGAANVAANIVALGGHAILVTPMAPDEEGLILTQRLQALGIDTRPVAAPDHRTVTKIRILARHQQILRLDEEDPAPLIPHAAVEAAFRTALPEARVVIFSDYGKGTLLHMEPLLAAARAAQKYVVVDPKGRDFARYAGADLLTPNLTEFEAVVGPCPDDETLAEKGQALCQRFGFGALLVTRSERGMTLFRPRLPPLHLPTRALDVFDATGAGDTVCAVLGLSLAAGHDLPHATGLANTAAGIAVGKLGAAAVTPAELLLALGSRFGDHFGIVTEATLLTELSMARLRGEQIVMTNGCFDLLHAGHVAYLAEARALGQRLVVAVNDDDSVRRLKGASRPLIPLAERMAVLAALGCVDWVVPFATDTPAELIANAAPDVLVKGGDYAPADIAGGEQVLKAGGEVLVLPFREGCSTSQIIDRVINGRQIP
jgi:D-beta-D-heptose 7-phosphate kinase/D-beta-D-heptose 1-phosphate adenosyltransferase